MRKNLFVSIMVLIMVVGLIGCGRKTTSKVSAPEPVRTKTTSRSQRQTDYIVTESAAETPAPVAEITQSVVSPEPFSILQPVNGKILIEINRSTTVMSEPDSNSDQQTVVARTEIFEYLGTSADGEWYKANVYSRIGWIRASQSSLQDVSLDEYNERMQAYKLQNGELIELKDGSIISEEEYLDGEYRYLNW